MVDSGTTNYMINNKRCFDSYEVSLGTKQISVASGKFINVVSKGHATLNPSLSLGKILHVPKLSTNLISFHKITKSLNCLDIFGSSYCVF